MLLQTLQTLLCVKTHLLIAVTSGSQGYYTLKWFEKPGVSEVCGSCDSHHTIAFPFREPYFESFKAQRRFLKCEDMGRK